MHYTLIMVGNISNLINYLTIHYICVRSIEVKL